MTWRGTARRAVNVLLGVAGLEVVRRERGWAGDRDFADYIPHREVVRRARESGLSVGDFIDATYNVPGATQTTIDQMVALGVFADPVERVCEIGPGSGRYLQKTIELCHPKSYEIYETATEWRDWLVRTYGVTAHQPDGSTLSQTPDRSVDLVHAHKVLYGLRITTLCRYLTEMARVVRPGGSVVFDVLTEDCLDSQTLEKWWASGARHASTMTAYQFTVDYLTRLGLTLVGTFTIPMAPGVTRYFVFAAPR